MLVVRVLVSDRFNDPKLPTVSWPIDSVYCETSSVPPPMVTGPLPRAEPLELVSFNSPLLTTVAPIVFAVPLTTHTEFGPLPLTVSVPRPRLIRPKRSPSLIPVSVRLWLLLLVTDPESVSGSLVPLESMVAGPFRVIVRVLLEPTLPLTCKVAGVVPLPRKIEPVEILDAAPLSWICATCNVPALTVVVPL